MMRKLALTGFTLAFLAGCAQQGPYGDFVNAADLNQRLAADTAQQLEVLYPPGTTQFNLGQPAQDAFGAALVANLRSKGFAVAEFSKEPKKGDGVVVRYIVDQPAGLNLYRVSLAVNGQSLSRAYVANKDKSVVPAGAWVHKED